jgi:hypothetical protein
VNVIGELLDQPPVVVVSACPSTADPDTTGSEVLVGRAEITGVAFEAAVCGPSAFAAVTRTRRRDPTSADDTMYAVVDAPGIVAQFEPSGRPPSAPQRTHW